VTRKDYTESCNNFDNIYIPVITKMGGQLQRKFRYGAFEIPEPEKDDFRPTSISNVTNDASSFTHNFGANFTGTGFLTFLDRMYFAADVTLPKYFYADDSASSELIRNHGDFENGLNNFINKTNLVNYATISAAYYSSTGGVLRTVELSLNGTLFEFGPIGSVALGGIYINSSKPYNSEGNIYLQIEKIGTSFKIYDTATVDVTLHDVFDFNYFNSNHAWADASRSGAMIQSGFSKTSMTRGQIGLVEAVIDGNVDINERVINP